MSLPKSLLVPTDFSAGSDRALGYAIELARALRLEIFVLHAYEIPMLGFPDGVMVATPELATRVADGAKIGLEKALAVHQATDVKMHSLLKTGPSWRTIVDTAKELEIGMIVMGTHGRHGLPRALLGSVAEKVVRTATCPVLTVHVDDVGA